MKRTAFTLLVLLGFISVLSPEANAQAITDPTTGNHEAIQTADNDLIAIDVLIEPDQSTIARARRVNARLRATFPAGYELDATHAPHVTLLQRFVRAKDFDSVATVLSNVFAAERPAGLQLTAKSIDYVIWGGVALTVLVIDRTPDLMRLHQKVIEALVPFSVSGGTGTAFVGTGINAETIGWVETFVPKSSGPNYLPHVTVGVAKEDFVKQVKAEPFQAFNFKPDGIAVYQLGNFGTAAKKLWQYQAIKPLPSGN